MSAAHTDNSPAPGGTALCRRIRELARQRWPIVLLTLATVLLLLARLWHIRADFADFRFYSQDGARYTDEGFYTSAALNHFIFGRAILPGGWNPGIFMPVWPIMTGLVFALTGGVSLAGARTLSVLCCWAGVGLVYLVSRQYRGRLFASIAAFLAAVNALGFLFGRLALLEPALVMYLLLALYLAGTVRHGGYARAVTTGIVFVLAALTKTTAMFALPAVLLPIWANHREDRAARWKLIATTLGTAIVLLEAVKIFWFAHFPADAAILFGMAPLWQIEQAPLKLARFFYRGTWIDPVLFPIALVCFGAAIFRLRGLWRDPLFLIAFLWETGYAAFIVYHVDGPPRYFAAMIPPTIWLAMIFVEWALREKPRAGMVLAVLVAVSVLWNTAVITSYLVHPQYKMRDASLAIKHMVQHGGATIEPYNSLLIGRGADEVSLLSDGLAAMDSDGALPLKKKLDRYHPGWFMRWTDGPGLRVLTVAERRKMTEAAIFRGLNPYTGGGIQLYRLAPKTQP
jgi:4-amino-4-deoxy-L-arabinose transferase-like glycosyltransferase